MNSLKSDLPKAESCVSNFDKQLYFLKHQLARICTICENAKQFTRISLLVSYPNAQPNGDKHDLLLFENDIAEGMAGEIKELLTAYAINLVNKITKAVDEGVKE